MKKLFITLLLLLPSLVSMAQYGYDIMMYAGEYDGSDKSGSKLWYYDETNGAILTLRLSLFNMSTTSTYSGEIRAEIRPIVGDSVVTAKIKTMPVGYTEVPPGEESSIQVRIGELDAAMDEYSISFYFKYFDENDYLAGIATTDYMASVPGLKEGLTGRLPVSGQWTDNGGNILTFSSQLLVGNSSDNVFNDSVKISCIPYDSSLQAGPAIEKTIVVEASAKGNTIVPFVMEGFDKTMREYKTKVSYYSSTLGKWKEMSGVYTSPSLPAQNSLTAYFTPGEWSYDQATDTYSLPVNLTIVNNTGSVYNDKIEVLEWRFLYGDTNWNLVPSYLTNRSIADKDSVILSYTLTTVNPRVAFELDPWYYSDGSRKGIINTPDNLFAVPTTLGINGVRKAMVNNSQKVYDITGRYIGTMKGNEMSKLMKGIYIIGGKKLLVK